MGGQEVSTVAQNKEASDWRAKHPLLKAAKEGVGFICHHTRDLTRGMIDEAIRYGKSIEIDLCVLGPSEGDFPPGLLTSRHHPWFYLARGLEIPDHQTVISPVDIVRQLADKGVFIKFDLKNVAAIPWLLRLAQEVPPHLRMGHCFLEELHHSYDEEEGHNVTEYISLADVRDIREALDSIPFQVSCRGVGLEGLMRKEGDSYPLVDELCGKIKGEAEVINFGLMGGEILPTEIAVYTWKKHGIMAELNIDKNPRTPLGVPFLGTTDNMSLAMKMES